MHGQQELSLPQPSVFSLCERHPLPLSQLRLAGREGGRILPIVGGNNMGAELLLQECLEHANVLHWNTLFVKAGPSGAPCDSVVDAIAKELGCYRTGGANLFGHLPDAVRKGNYQLVVIGGAAHLSEDGVWEMVQFLDDLSSSAKGDGPLPLFVWHACPNWQRIFRYDDPPLEHFLGDVLLSTVPSTTSAECMASVFPALGQVLKNSRPACERLFEKTVGRIGLLATLDDVLSKRDEGHREAASAEETLEQLLELFVGSECQEATVKTRPPERSRSASLPPSERKYAPPLTTRSRRGRRGKRRKPRK